MSSPTVLIIGCGVAGPVIGIFLKRKGYSPIIFEKAQTPGDVGASLSIWPNGMHVLDKIGMAAKVQEVGSPLTRICEMKSSGEVLGQVPLYELFKERYGQPAHGIRRVLFTSMLKEAAVQEGIDVRVGWTLESVREDGNSVAAVFSGGREETGAFLVGCDGMKGVSRKFVLERHGVVNSEPTFTGVFQASTIQKVFVTFSLTWAQTACFSPTPSFIKEGESMCTWNGDGMHALCYPISEGLTSWVVTQGGDEESKDSWGIYDAATRATAKAALLELLKDWDSRLLDFAISAGRIIRYGIYDRPALDSSQWFSKRCVLIGDAAHPTSVHIGQGANMAMEDCYLLSKHLPSVTPGATGLRTEQLQEAFKAMAEVQRPRTAALVKAARAQGDARVAKGSEALKRNDEISRRYADPNLYMARLDFMYNRPD